MPLLRYGARWGVLAKAAGLGVEKGLGRHLANTASSIGLPSWKGRTAEVMEESGVQERRPEGVLGRLYPGEEKTPVLYAAVQIGFLAPIWAWVQVCCPFVAMVTTEPSGSLQGVSISGSLEACGVMDRLHAQMRVLFLLPVVTRLLGDRAGVEAWASVSPGRLRQGRKLTGLGVCPGLTDDREVLPGPRHLLPQH